jgi:hypothetical protein
LAGVTTRQQANELLRRKLLPEYNRRFTVAAARRRNAHRDLGSEHCLAAILSVQATRVVDNDYTVRFCNRCFQLLPPAWAGLRRGKVVLEQRLDGTLAIRFDGRYLRYKEIPLPARPRGRRTAPGGSVRASATSDAKRHGCGPAASVAAANGQSKAGKKPYRPAPDHPWRKSARPKPGKPRRDHAKSRDIALGGSAPQTPRSLTH